MSKLEATPENRTFRGEKTFEAYNNCVRWLETLGCSVGSMQRGAPTAVMFGPDWIISKHRNLDKREVWETHGWIHGEGGRFRQGPIRFEITPAGKAALSRARGEGGEE